MRVTVCLVEYSVPKELEGKEHTAYPESRVGILLKKLINCSHLLTSWIPSWPEQRFIIFYPMSRQSPGEITSLMSNFQIGVTSTSIALGPHINLLQGETTIYSVTAMKEISPPAHLEKRYTLYSFSYFPGQSKYLLLHSAPMCFKVTDGYEGSQEQKQ